MADSSLPISIESIPATYKLLYGFPSASKIGGSTTRSLLDADIWDLTQVLSSVPHNKAVGSGFI